MKLLFWFLMAILFGMVTAADENLEHLNDRLLNRMETVIKHQRFLEKQMHHIATNPSVVANHTSQLLNCYEHGGDFIMHQTDNSIAKLLERMEKILENQIALESQMNQVAANLSAVVNRSSELLDFHQETAKNSCSILCKSGLVMLEPFNVEAFCDAETLGGGWIIIQQRIDGSVKFRRNWLEYRNGFGIVGNDTEFWLGLEVVHQLTKSQPHELVVEIKNEYRGLIGHARYSEFSLSGEDDKYRIKMGIYSGNVRYDSMELQRNKQFSSFDSDNDNGDKNCADIWGGGWWYHNNCQVE